MAHLGSTTSGRVLLPCLYDGWYIPMKPYLSCPINVLAKLNYSSHFRYRNDSGRLWVEASIDTVLIVRGSQLLVGGIGNVRDELEEYWFTVGLEICPCVVETSLHYAAHRTFFGINSWCGFISRQSEEAVLSSVFHFVEATLALT